MDPSSPATTRFGRFRAALSESPPLLWAFVYFFCLLSGYYVLRPVREAMAASSDVQAVFPPAMIEFFAVRGLALKDFTLQVLFTCTFIIMLLLQPAYGWLVSRYPRRVFLPAVYGFFIGTLLLFYVLFDSGMPGRGMAFFLWIAVFNLFAVAVFWSFMADVFSNAEARKFYGYIGAAGTVGAILGPSRIAGGDLVDDAAVAQQQLVEGQGRSGGHRCGEVHAARVPGSIVSSIRVIRGRGRIVTSRRGESGPESGRPPGGGLLLRIADARPVSPGASSSPRPGRRANAPWSRPPLPSPRTCPRPCPGRRRRSRRHGPCACPEAPRHRQ